MRQQAQSMVVLDTAQTRQTQQNAGRNGRCEHRMDAGLDERVGLLAYRVAE